MVQGLPTVEQFTPDVMWTTMFGVIALGLLFLIGFKVYDAIYTIRERRKQEKEAEKPDFAKRVSKEVISDLSPRLEDIERRLNDDDKRIKRHDRMLEEMTKDQGELHEGLSAIAQFMLASGTNGDMKTAVADLQKFLAKKL